MPNLFITGGAMISDLEWNRRVPPHHTVVSNPKVGKEKVNLYASKGLKYLKLYSKLEQDDMRAVVEAANKNNLSMYAHIDNNIVSIDEAMDLGVKNCEHFFTLVANSLTLSDHWDLLNEKFELSRIASIDEFSAVMTFSFEYIKDDPELSAKIDQLLKRMASEGASISTTIHVLGAAAGKTYFFSSFNYFPVRTSPRNTYSSNQRERLKGAFRVMMDYMKKTHELGIPLRIGTDCRYGGKALLSELLLMAEAGFSTEDILQIATWNGAKAMKLDNQLGSIEVGKKADLVIFEQNPMEDVQYFLGKKAVIKGGKVFE